MKQRLTSIAWSFVYLLLLLSLATPFTVITVFLIVIPGVVLYTIQSTRTFYLHVMSIWLITAILFGPSFLILAVIFIVPSIVMGRQYKKRASAFKTLMTGTASLICMSLLLLMLITLVFDVNLAHSIEDTINSMTTQMVGITENPVTGKSIWSPELNQQYSELTVRMIPFTLVLTSLLIAVITHAISRPTLTSLGHVLPKLRHIREWKLPRSLIWYYLLCLILDIFVASAHEGFFGTILVNLMPILMFCFMIQTVSFFFYLVHHKKWNYFMLALLIIALIFIQPLMILGILDIAFPLREMVTRSKR